MLHVDVLDLLLEAVLGHDETHGGDAQEENGQDDEEEGDRADYQPGRDVAKPTLARAARPAAQVPRVQRLVLREHQLERAPTLIATHPHPEVSATTTTPVLITYTLQL